MSDCDGKLTFSCWTLPGVDRHENQGGGLPPRDLDPYIFEPLYTRMVHPERSNSRSLPQSIARWVRNPTSLGSGEPQDNTASPMEWWSGRIVTIYACTS